MPNTRDKRRVFEVIALKDYGNYHTLQRYIVVSDKMPVPSDIPLRGKDEVIETKELHAEVIVK